MPLAFAISAQAGEPSCFVELPVYDPFGARLDFKVTRVSPENDRQMNLLGIASEELELNAIGDRVTYSGRSLFGSVVVITVEDRNGKTITLPILLMQCSQRVSLRYGQSSTPLGDTSFEILRGRATGCKWSGEWWIRAMPMFGTESHFAPFEGYIDADGTFSIGGHMNGERHIVVIGKNKQPLWSFGFNVTVGGSNVIGDVDLAGKCQE